MFSKSFPFGINEKLENNICLLASKIWSP
uniref:Uncharacterized protein n=1 Tax=Triticum urartu TaxID=4572 RepID=A0A8R7PI71_TRIUA